MVKLEMIRVLLEEEGYESLPEFGEFQCTLARRSAELILPFASQRTSRSRTPTLCMLGCMRGLYERGASSATDHAFHRSPSLSLALCRLASPLLPAQTCSLFRAYHTVRCDLLQK